MKYQKSNKVISELAVTTPYTFKPRIIDTHTKTIFLALSNQYSILTLKKSSALRLIKN
jgi:hypothetical protein